MKRLILLIGIIAILTGCNRTVKIEETTLKDKIKGGLVGQLIGNLNGLPYEEKYNNEPGTLSGYIPGLPLGAFTDDDTDIEWMYIYFMEKYKILLLPYDTIANIWKRNMNYKIYSTNTYARQLMEIGFDPSETGNVCLNPWASVNVAGQFNCETFGLIAPAMPQTAGRIGLHYTRIVIDNEPAQTTQFYTAMIATAFTTSDPAEILEAGIKTLDKKSQIYQATMNAMSWYKEYPDDWQKSRNRIRQTYYFITQSNKSVMNHASIVSQYLYGHLDLIKTMEISFNWGFDADCDAATLGTIIGVVKGYRWMEQQGWVIKDRYYNNARPELPSDETITAFSDRIYNVAKTVILKNGGQYVSDNQMKYVLIKAEKPEVLVKTRDEDSAFKDLEKKYSEFTKNTFSNSLASDQELKKALYLSLVLKTAEETKKEHPLQWQKAVSLLQQDQDFMYTLYHGMENPINRLAKATGVNMLPVEASMNGKYEFKLKGYKNARNVYLGGTMNHWLIWKNPMTFDGEGWVCRIDLLPGKYEYKFNVDGKWVFDPGKNKETNFEGNTNSVAVLN